LLYRDTAGVGVGVLVDAGALVPCQDAIEPSARQELHRLDLPEPWSTVAICFSVGGVRSLCNSSESKAAWRK